MEKTLYNQVGEVKGKVSEKEDSFSFQFTPQNENLRRTRGSLFTLVTVNGDIKDKYEKAKTFYHAFQSSYYARASGSIINGLSDTLEQIDRDIVKKSSQVGIDLSLVAAVFWGSVLYLAKIGPNTIYVARGDKLKQLEFNKVASGVLEDQDTVCLASDQVEKNLSKEELNEFLNQDKFEKALESLDKKIAGVAGATCIVIRLSVNKPEEETVNLPIAEVDETGKVEFSETTDETDNTSSEEAKKDVETEPLPTALPINAENKPRINLPVSIWLEKAKTIGELVFTKISRPWVKKEGEIVDPVTQRKARIIQVVAVIALVLVISLAFNMLTRGAKEQEDKTASLISAAENQINEAKNIKTIDPTRAKNLIGQAKAQLEDAKEQGSKSNKISELEEAVALLTAEITRSYRIENLSTVFDFTKLQSNAKTSRTAQLENILLVTDKSSNSIFLFDTNTDQGQKIEGDFSEPENVTSFSGGFYVQTKDSILRIEKTTNKVTNLPSGNVWGSIAGAATFQSNLRLVDKGKNEIWNYINTSRGLSSPQAYLKGEKPNLSNAAAIAIDDLVWVVTKEGTVYKFALGNNQEFSLTNFNEPFGQVVDFYTNSSTKNHYILDQGKGRVIISSKDGVYQSQYGHDQLHQATSLVVKEDEKMIYFVSGSKLYSFKFQ